MSPCASGLLDDSWSDEEFDLNEEEDIAVLVAMHKGKKRKHGGSVYGRVFIGREWLDAHRLMRNYFGSPPIFSEKYFRRRSVCVQRLVHPYLLFREAAWSILRAEEELCKVAWT